MMVIYLKLAKPRTTATLMVSPVNSPADKLRHLLACPSRTAGSAGTTPHKCKTDGYFGARFALPAGKVGQERSRLFRLAGLALWFVTKLTKVCLLGR